MGYHIWQGEPLGVLSAKYQIPVSSIVRANGLQHIPLKRGMRLTIPERQKEEQTIYMVQPGDTVYGIANQHHITMMQLMQQNHLGHPDELRPGMRLVLPQENQRVYTVKATDTPETIAQTQNVSLMELKKYNDFSRGIYTGMQLILPPNS